MRIFSLRGASHFCSSFAPQSGLAERSLDEFRESRLHGRYQLIEGTNLFDEYRACALREIERSIFLSAAHYRRSLDLLLPSSLHWAHVTLYYGAWFAARALLGMFGCAVLHNHVVHVDQSLAGQQQLYVQKIGNRQNQYPVASTGSHQRFWEIFYATAPSIRRFVSVNLSVALSPVSNQSSWLIEQRNRVNYNSAEGISLGSSLSLNSLVADFPNRLPGVLNTQYRVCEGMLEASCHFADRFGLWSDAFNGSNSFEGLQRRILERVYSPTVPDLVDKTKKEALFVT